MSTPTQTVYRFGATGTEGAAEMKNLLGGKGANLAEMCRLGIPVPPGFTISTEACAVYTERGRDAVLALVEPEVRRAVAESLPEALLGRMADDPDWRVRWEVARRAAPALLLALRDDPDSEVRQMVRSRLTVPKEVPHG